jgi:hypothetical protein
MARSRWTSGFMVALGVLALGFSPTPAFVGGVSAQVVETGPSGSGNPDLNCVVTSRSGDPRNCTASEAIKACIADADDALAQCLDQAATWAARVACQGWDLFDRITCSSDLLKMFGLKG